MVYVSSYVATCMLNINETGLCEYTYAKLNINETGLCE